MAVRYTSAQRGSSPRPTSDGLDIFAQAVRAHGSGQVALALDLYQQLLATDSKQTKLFELAGIACMQLGRFDAALNHLRAAQRADPSNTSILNNLGITLKHLGEYEAAVQVLRSALEKAPPSAETLNNLGAALESSKQFREAINAFLQALEVDGENVSALQNLKRIVVLPGAAGIMVRALESRARAPSLGEREIIAVAKNAVAELEFNTRGESLTLSLKLAQDKAQRGDAAAAVEIYRAVLAKSPEHLPTWNELGLLLRQMKDYGQAMLAFRRVVELDAKSALAWNNLGTCYLDLGDRPQALSALQQAERLAPELANVQCNLGMLYRAEQDVQQAIARYQRALQLDDGLFEAHFNLGNLRSEYGDEGGAHSAFIRAVEISPHSAEATYSLGLTEADPGVAAGHFKRALNLRAHYPEAEVARLHNQLKACDWTDLPQRLHQLEVMVQDPAMPAFSPFWMLALSGSRKIQLACARKWVESKVLPGVAPRQETNGSRHATRNSVPRVGMLSGDLRQHAVGELLRDTLSLIDPKQCELYAYDSSPDDGSDTRRALLSVFKSVRPAAQLTVAALAEQIASDGIDVLLDLSGFTQHSRSRVLALRPARVQASYLGFPGSMGWNALDYIVADDHLIPALHEADYDERVVRLPLCYQPARHFAPDAGPHTRDGQAAPQGALPTRAQEGLPASGMVFACFGNAYKLRPEVFDCWLRLLRSTPKSVLWFARFNQTAENNLREYARHRGVDSSRLVFAPIVPLDQHSARLALADLFLDTAPYGSGMTAAQTLYAGVPLLSIAGATYVGRMATSLLHALGMDALIASDLQDYEQRALRLAQDPEALNRHRRQIEAARDAGPVFDIQRSARDLERMLVRMAETACPASPPYSLALSKALTT